MKYIMLIIALLGALTFTTTVGSNSATIEGLESQVDALEAQLESAVEALKWTEIDLTKCRRDSVDTE